MVDKTLDQLTTEVQMAIYQAAGVSTQVYSEALIQGKINDAFIVLAKDPDCCWKRYSTFISRTLDGTTGRTTVALNTTFQEFSDIEAVYPADSNKQLTAGDIMANPVMITGDYPLQYIADGAGTDLIQVLPLTAAGDIVVVGNAYPTLPFIGPDTVPFDYIAIKYYVAWQYMTEDATNAAAAELLRQQFQTRYEQLKKGQMKAPLAINGRGSAAIPTVWY